MDFKSSLSSFSSPSFVFPFFPFLFLFFLLFFFLFLLFFFLFLLIIFLSLFVAFLHHPLLFQDIDVGDLCVGKYSEDNVWYRAEVIGVRAATPTAAAAASGSPRLVTLRFIDYGNEEELNFVPVSFCTGSSDATVG